jgi:hypothetical protein
MKNDHLKVIGVALAVNDLAIRWSNSPQSPRGGAPAKNQKIR